MKELGWQLERKAGQGKEKQDIEEEWRQENGGLT